MLGILNVISRSPDLRLQKKKLRKEKTNLSGSQAKGSNLRPRNEEFSESWPCDLEDPSESEDSPEKIQQKLDLKILLQKSSDLVAMGKLINGIKGRIPNEIQINADEPDDTHGHLVIVHDPHPNLIKKKIENLPLSLKLGVIQLEKAKDAINLDAKKISEGLSKKLAYKEAIRLVRRMDRKTAELGRKLEAKLLEDKKKSDAVDAKIIKEIKRVTEVWDNKGPQERARLDTMEKYSKERILARQEDALE